MKPTSIKGYARERGCSPAAVRKAMERLDIAKLEDGQVDAEELDALWPRDEGGTAGEPDDTSYAEARRRKELALAHLRELEFKQKAGELVNTRSVQDSWFAVLRLTRNRILNIPDRVADMLATETDAAVVHTTLMAELNQALSTLADEVEAEAA